MKRTNGLVALALCAGAASAAADTVNLSFYRISNNAAMNVASQFNVAVSDVNATTISFKFTNAVGIQSSISEIYFDGPGPFVQSIPGLIQQGTNFVAGGAVPSNLPGGENLNPPFQATTIFSADAQGNPSNGIDTASDFLDMRFTLLAGKTFQDVVNELTTGDLRIGLHVRSIGPGGAPSDAFVNNPPAVIPLPPAAWAGLSCMVGIGAVRMLRRRGQ